MQGNVGMHDDYNWTGIRLDQVHFMAYHISIDSTSSLKSRMKRASSGHINNWLSAGKCSYSNIVFSIYTVG